MTPKTILRKNGQEVVLYECCVIIGNSLKTFCIKETKQYFCNEKRAIRAAHDLLLKKTLSKHRYNEKQREKRLRIGANRIARTYKCYTETKQYIVRWDKELYLETKKNLCAELKTKLDDLCAKYEFTNAHAAIGFLERTNQNNHGELN